MTLRDDPMPETPSIVEPSTDQPSAELMQAAVTTRRSHWRFRHAGLLLAAVLLIAAEPASGFPRPLNIPGPDSADCRAVRICDSIFQEQGCSQDCEDLRKQECKSICMISCHGVSWNHDQEACEEQCENSCTKACEDERQKTCEQKCEDDKLTPTPPMLAECEATDTCKKLVQADIARRLEIPHATRISPARRKVPTMKG